MDYGGKRGTKKKEKSENVKSGKGDILIWEK